MPWRQHIDREARGPTRRGRAGLRGRLWLRRLSRRWLPAHIPIAYKLIVVFSLLVTVGMGLLGGLIVDNQTRILEQQIRKFGETLVQRAADASVEPLLAGDTLALELITNGLIEDDAILGAAIYGEDGRVVTHAGVVPPAARIEGTGLAERLREGMTLEWASGAAGTRRELVAFLTPIVFQDVVAGYAALTFERSVLHRAETETILAIVVITLIVLALGVAASVALAGRLSRPIDRLMEAARAIGRGRYDYRFTDRRNDELGVLMETLNRMSEGLLRKEQVEDVFSRYVSPQVARRALTDLEELDQVDLGGRHCEASVLFADIVGFTSLSEGRAPEEVSALLNEYFTRIARVVEFCGGHIDKYMGDCAMVVFGVPEQYEDHAFRALACAWMVLDLVERLNELRRSHGDAPIHFRIGVNSGTMLAGNMGAADRMEYTVVGDAVNLASRLGHAGEPGQVVFREAMLELPNVAGRVVAHTGATVRLRGKSEPVAAAVLEAIEDPFCQEMREENRRIVALAGREAA